MFSGEKMGMVAEGGAQRKDLMKRGERIAFGMVVTVFSNDK